MIISTFASVQKAYVESELSATWSEAQQLFTYCHPARRKEDVQMFNLGEFRQLSDAQCEPGRRYHRNPQGERLETWDEIPATRRRSKSNLIAIHGIVLDIDRDHTIASAQQLYCDREYVLFSTFRHQVPDNNNQRRDKFRIILPFTQPLLAADIPGRQQAIRQAFPGVDPASFSMSQSFYFHSGANPVTHINTGHMIDPYGDFAYQPVPEPQPRTTVIEDWQWTRQAQAAVVRSLLTCGGVSRARLLPLASICKTTGLDLAVFRSIAHQILRSDSTGHNEAALEELWHYANDRIKNTTRDAWISEHGGIPPNRHFTTQQEIAEIKREIERRLCNQTNYGT